MYVIILNCIITGKFNTCYANFRKTCRIPAIEGTKYFYKDWNQNVSLSHATEIEQYRIVEEDCEAGYHKVVPSRFMVCSESGQWRPFVTEELCLSKYQCPIALYCFVYYTPIQIM